MAKVTRAVPIAAHNATYRRVQDEVTQSHPQRERLYDEIEEHLKHDRRKPVIVAFFTSFLFPVIIEDRDADILEETLQNTNLAGRDLVLLLNSPGGDALAAERIVNICRSYSDNGRFTVIVPKMAKSAATMICFGAQAIGMSPTSELGPIDPQIPIFDAEGHLMRYQAAHEIIESYQHLMDRTSRAKGRIEAFLEQLARYDAREIRWMRSQQQLSESVAVRCLGSGCFNGLGNGTIKTRIKPFLDPNYTKVHGRPIYRDVAARARLNVTPYELRSDLWRAVWHLYVRLDHILSTNAAKVIETSKDSYIMGVQGHR